MMLKSIEQLLEFVGDMNETEINDHIKARPDGIAVSFGIDGEWLDGWNRAVLATVEKIEKEVSERYMELPVDADGVPIRVGDVMESEVDYLFDGKPFTVRALVLCEDGWEVGDGRFGNRYEPDSLHHHHEPTVEDVLREFAEKITDSQIPDVHPTYEEAIAEYAQRLQLREVDE